MKKLLISIMVVFMISLLAVGCDGGESTRVEDENGNGEEEAAEENGNGEEEAEETEQDKNARQNPAEIGERFRVSRDYFAFGKVTFEIEMLDVISGDEAWQIVHEGNQFNEEPEEGMEYVLAEFEVEIIETEEDEAFSPSLQLHFDAVSEDGVQYDAFVSVAGIDDLSADLYEGASVTGYHAEIVEKDDNPVLAVDRGRDTEVWFDLRANK